MPKAVQEIYTQFISNLPPTERLHLATLILNGLVKQDIAVIDDSDTWTEQNQLNERKWTRTTAPHDVNVVL